MNEIYTHIKTRTEVNSLGKLLIVSFSDLNNDNTTVPAIFKSDIPNEKIIVDNVNVAEGQLVLSFDGQRAGELVDNTGELVIDPDNDDASRYSRGGTDNAFLIYNS